MIANRPKAELIISLNSAVGEKSIQNVLSLLEMLVQETRTENDTAPVDQVLANQGKIRGYQIFQEHILKGLPSVKKSS